MYFFWIHFLALKVITTVPKPLDKLLVDHLSDEAELTEIGILLVLSNIER